MESDGRRDRLSELPDSLILEILSRLRMRYAVRTTILSKRWKDLWTTVPRLDFWADYESFICGALAKWNGAKIKEFALAFNEDDIPSDILDSCLLIPIDKQVEELCVHVGNNIPQRLYSCSSLTKLVLTFCVLKIDENVNVQWNQLKSLTIQDICNLSGDAMNRIIFGAPLLEELMLLSVDISENLDIRSTSLKKLRISRPDCSPSCPKSAVMRNTTLTIWAPNLLSLDISACVYGTCSLDVPSLTDAVIRFEEPDPEEIDDDDLPPLQMFDQFFGSLCHVEKLTLSDLSIQILVEMKENHMVAHFSNTKFLKLYVYSAEAEGLLHVLAMFPELMNLVVEFDQDRCYTIDSEPRVAMVDFDAFEMTFPNPSLLQLETVDITWSKCPTSIIPMVKIMLKNANVLEKMVLRLKVGRSDSEKKIFMLAKMVMMSMPRSSPIAQVIIISQ